MPLAKGNEGGKEVTDKVRGMEEITKVCRRHIPFRRLDLSVFDGENPIKWNF